MMRTLFHGLFALLGGLLAILGICMGVADGLKGDFRMLGGGLLFAFIYGSFALREIRSIREAKKKFKEDLADMVSTLEAPSHEAKILHR